MALADVEGQRRAFAWETGAERRPFAFVVIGALCRGPGAPVVVVWGVGWVSDWTIVGKQEASRATARHSDRLYYGTFHDFFFLYLFVLLVFLHFGCTGS